VTLHPQGLNLEINTLPVPLCQYCPQPRQLQQQSEYQVSVKTFFFAYMRTDPLSNYYYQQICYGVMIRL
jgi:hypothetical protein